MKKQFIHIKKSGPVPDFLMVKKENEYKNAGSPILWYNIQYYILEEIIHGRPWQSGNFTGIYFIDCFDIVECLFLGD